MHELSVAQSIVDLACEQATKAEATKVLKIRLSLGVLSGVVKEALEFCFPLACKGTCAEGSELDIDVKPAKAHCPECGADFELEDFVLVCSRCGSMPVELVEGGELKVSSLDVE
jgi:hydrogenase nickel incorporation protein HypA/HybF